MSTPSVGDVWFIRNTGAGALQTVRVLAKYDCNVWSICETSMFSLPLFKQSGVDFEFVGPCPESDRSM